ncbi:MAG: S24/S26 family peptidase [Alistipes sp.]
MQLANKIFFAQVEELLAQGDEVQLRVKGYSMRPLLRNERETVILTPYHGEELHPLEIALFRHRGGHVLHRIVHIAGNRVTLQGDGNYRQQEHCATEDILATVRCIIRPNGRKIDCQSTSWQLRSRCWLALPALMRRYILALLFRLGYK